MSETVVPNYDDFIEEPQPLPEDKASRVNALVKRQLMLERKYAEAEALLKQVKQELESVSDQALPDLMDDLGISKLELKGGSTITIDTTIRASLGKTKDPEKAEKAIAWLLDNEHPHLIKHTLAIPFTGGQDELASHVAGELEAINEKLAEVNEAWSISVEDKTDVNPGTLSAFVRGELKEGRPVPEDLFNVHRARKAKIKV